MRRSYSAGLHSAKSQSSAQASWSINVSNTGWIFKVFHVSKFTFSAASWNPRSSLLWNSSWKLAALLSRGDLGGKEPGVGVTAPSLVLIIIIPGVTRLSPGLSISGHFSTKQRSSSGYSLTDTRTCCSQLNRFWNWVIFRWIPSTNLTLMYL